MGKSYYLLSPPLYRQYSFSPSQTFCMCYHNHMAKRISEKFGKVPNSKKTISEKFRKKTILSEATPEHILTIRRAHETLVNLGYNYTERSVNNWCYPTPNREPLLDCALDVGGHIRITKRSLEKRIIDIKQKDQIKQDEIAFSENQKSASEKVENDSARS